MDKDKQVLDLFFKSNKESIKNPIIRTFLADEKNFSLVKKAILYPSDSRRAIVDELFKAHFERVNKVKYISSLIHFFSIDYDKKTRKYKNRFLLTLDKSLPENNHSKHESYIKDDKNGITSNNLLDNIEDDVLAKALMTLTEKQYLILEMIYVKEMSLKEIALVSNSTPQNISNQHRKSLVKLNEIIAPEVMT